MPERKGEIRYLGPSEYDRWDDLVTASPQGSVSCLSWWLKAVGDNVRVLGYFENGRLVAGVPLHEERILAARVYRKPKLTYPWGVVMEPLVGKTASVARREMKLLENLAEHMAAIRGSIVMSFHNSLTNWLPFYWHGFTVSMGLSQVIDLDRIDRVKNELQNDARRLIAKASEAGLRVESCNASEALPLLRASYERQKMRLPYSADYFQKLAVASSDKGMGECFVARDSEGRGNAAVFVVWDDKCAYYVAGGGDPRLRNNGAGTLLVWHMIEFAASRTKRFDFGGSSVRAIEHFNRSFGAKQICYPRLMKLSLLPRLAMAARGGR